MMTELLVSLLACGPARPSKDEGDADADADSDTDADADADTDADGDTDTDITYTVETTGLPTVFRVVWTGGAPGTAHVAYGPPGDLRLVTPNVVEGDLGSILVWGVPFGTVWQAQLTLDTGDAVVTSPTLELDATGEGSTNLPPSTFEATGKPGSEWLLTSEIQQANAWVFQPDGKPVWWYALPPEEVTHYRLLRAAMSVDGQAIWLALVGQDVDHPGLIRRVSLDGSVEREIAVAGLSHDLVELEDGSVVCMVDDIREIHSHDLEGDALIEISPTGEQRTVFDTWDWYDPRNTGSGATRDGDWSHANALDWDPGQGRFLLSLRNFGAIVAIERKSGHPLWAFGGEIDDFGLTVGTRPKTQHQFQLTGNRMLLFANTWDSGDEPTAVVEYAIDETARSAKETWRLDSDPPRIMSDYGDVSALDDGTILVTWAMENRIERVDRKGVVTWTLTSDDQPLGYTTPLKSLYR